jgi:hypothetical protein
MKRCPDQENLSLYVDRELSTEEMNSIDKHLAGCSACRAEIKRIGQIESLLRDGIDETFARHRVTTKIMDEIRQPVAPETAADRPAFSFWRLLAFPALAMLLAAALWWTGVNQTKYHGQVFSVTCSALNKNSTVDGISPSNPTFFLTQPLAMNLQGEFKFAIIATHTCEFIGKGKSRVGLDQGNSLFFSDADMKFSWLSGPEATITVNGKKMKISETAVATCTSVLPGESCSVDPASGSVRIISEEIGEIDGIVDIASESFGNGSVVVEPQAEPLSDSGVGLAGEPQVQPEADAGFGKNPFTEEPIDLTGN